MNLLIGQELGHYRIVEQLGEGGMAIVYKAFDTHLERDVAVKVIRTDQFAPALLEKILKRFEREAKLLAKLSHPNIVGVIDYGEYDDIPYLVMEYLPGGTLKERLGKPIPASEAARILLPMARALDYAHRQGMIHRDVKPSNILITTDGEPMLTDFGIAKLLEGDGGQTLTGTGVGIGTPEYMAPEQWVGEATQASDQYSLGVIFYEMVTGRKPFTADTPAAILLKQTNDPLVSPKSIAMELSEEGEKFIYKAMARNPQDRFTDMAKFGEGLQTLTLIKTNLEKTESFESQNSVDNSKTVIEIANDTPLELGTSLQHRDEIPQVSSFSKSYEPQFAGGEVIPPIVSNQPPPITRMTPEKRKSVLTLGKFWLSCAIFSIPWIARGIVGGIAILKINNGMWPFQIIDWLTYIFLAICGLGIGLSFRIHWPMKWQMVFSFVVGLPLLNYIYMKILVGLLVYNPYLQQTRWFFVLMDSFCALLFGLLISFICILYFRRKWLLIFLIPLEWIGAVLVYYTFFERFAQSSVIFVSYLLYFAFIGTISGFFTLFTLCQTMQQKTSNISYNESLKFRQNQR